MPAPSAPASGGQSSQQSPAQLNAMQRQIVIGQSVEMTQQISSQTINPQSNNILAITPRPVGLTKRFIVEIIATLTNGAGGTATLTDMGTANLLSNVTLLDLQNNTRINTSGFHLQALATAKRRHPFSACGQFNTNTGNSLSQMFNVPPATWPVFTAPQTLAANAAGTVRAVFEVPLAYTDEDLRGAIYLNVINATAQLNLTLNLQAMVGAAPADYTAAVYQGSTGTFTSATVNVYQVYLDQLPVNSKTGQVIIPSLDVSTVYELKQSTLQGMTVGNDFPIPYTNFRQFASTFLVYNNSGTATGRLTGADLNYLTLQVANFTNIWKVGPLMMAKWARDIFMQDLPAGVYYSSSRKRNISTTQFGNQELILNPITAGAAAYVTVYWEDFANIANVTSGASLSAG